MSRYFTPIFLHIYFFVKINSWSFLFLGISFGRSLKDMRLSVPRAVRLGHSVTLGCEYDLEDAALYSVKWYRNNEEFYRYVPKEEPPIRVFTSPGVTIDVSFIFIIIFNEFISIFEYRNTWILRRDFFFYDRAK